MIIGVGIDVVDIARFGATLERTPALRERLFTPEERGLPLQSLAARFAAKEAVAKALGAPGNMDWQDATVDRRRGERLRASCRSLDRLLPARLRRRAYDLCGPASSEGREEVQWLTRRAYGDGGRHQP